MSKITAEIEVKQGRMEALKGVAKKIEDSLAPLNRGRLGFSRLGSALAPVTSIAAGVASSLAMVGGAAAVVGIGVASGVRAALDLGGRLSDLESQTGIAAGSLMRLEQAFKNNGLEADKVGPSINKMQKAIYDADQGMKEAVSTFESMGLSLADLKAASPEMQFQRVSRAISSIQDPTKKAALAMRVFGRTGGQMMALFNDSNAFSDAAKQIGTQAEIMDRNAAVFDGVSDKLVLAGLKTQGFFVGVADAVVPVLVPLLDRFEDLDLAQKGQEYGLGLAASLDEVFSQNIGQTLYDWSVYAGMTYANYLIDATQGVVDMLASIPGMGFMDSVNLQKWDTSEIDQKRQMRADRILQKSDELSKKSRRSVVETLQDLDSATSSTSGGSRVAMKQFFSTNMGLFVKDPLLSEARQSNVLLKEIKTSIDGLRVSGRQPLAGGAMRFT